MNNSQPPIPPPFSLPTTFKSAALVLNTEYIYSKCRVEIRVGNFRQKTNSAEDGIDRTNGYFRWNSGCSAEQKISEFRSEPFRGRENNSEFRSVVQKIEVNSHNSVPNPSAEENTTRNSVPWNQNRCKFSEFCSEPFRGREHNSEFLSVQQKIEIYSRVPLC